MGSKSSKKPSVKDSMVAAYFSSSDKPEERTEGNTLKSKVKKGNEGKGVFADSSLTHKGKKGKFTFSLPFSTVARIE